jgi:hypothetical protein
MMDARGRQACGERAYGKFGLVTMRCFRPFLTLLIAAAILNFVVAWVCILWSPYRSVSKPSEQRTESGFPATIAGPYGQQGWWFTCAGLGVWESVPSNARGAEGQFLYWRGQGTPAYYRGGWPMHSLQSTVTFHDYRRRWDLPAGEILRRGMQTNWLPSGFHARKDRRLPVVPCWPGLAVNTLVYCGILVAARWSGIRVREWCRPRLAMAARASPAATVVSLTLLVAVVVVEVVVGSR